MKALFVCFITGSDTKTIETHFSSIFPYAHFLSSKNQANEEIKQGEPHFLITSPNEDIKDTLLTRVEQFATGFQKILLHDAGIKRSMLPPEFLDFFDEVITWKDSSEKYLEYILLRDEEENIAYRLSESDRKYKTLVETLPGIIYRCKNDSNWTMDFISPKIVRLSGYPARDLINNKKLSYSDIIVPKDREKVWLTIQKAIKTNRAFAIEYQIKTSAGKIKWVWEQGKAVNDAQGNQYLEGVIMDINDRKNLLSRVDIMRELTIAFTWAKDIPQMVKSIKAALNKIIPATNITLTLFDRQKKEFLVPYIDEDRECFSVHAGLSSLNGLVLRRKRSILLLKREIVKLIRQGKIEFRGEIPAVWLGVPLQIHDLPAGVISICHPENEFAIDESDKDLLEFVSTQVSVALLKKKAEEESNKLLQALEQIPAALFIIGIDYKIVYANRKSVEITGFENHEMIGKIPNIFNPKLNKPADIEELTTQLTQSGFWNGEFENFKKDGSVYYENVRISGIINHLEKITHYVMLKSDVSQQKRLEKQLIATTKRAEESDNLKSAFMANISHEIRTPMNAIIGFTEMLKNDDFPADEKLQFIDLVLENARSLMSKLDNIIDITKIESGKLKLTKTLCSANKLLYDHYYILLKNKEKLEKSNIEIKACQHIENENYLFISDAFRISQVLQKLTENALKYTFFGTIEIGYQIEKSGSDEWIDFYVKDTGVGISPEMKGVLFDKFRVAGSDPYKASIATGFGLYISKSIARLLDGDLTFETSKGDGTTFHLKLPFHKVNHENNKLEKTAGNAEKRALHYPNKTILIAEDEETNFKLLEVMLRKTNVKIERAYNGKQAVDYIKGGNHADLVLMDVRMPIMNGYEATELIKNFAPTLPVIIQTAFAFNNDREKGFGSGCDEYLSKPIKASDLYLILEKFFGK